MADTIGDCHQRVSATLPTELLLSILEKLTPKVKLVNLACLCCCCWREIIANEITRELRWRQRQRWPSSPLALTKAGRSWGVKCKGVSLADAELIAQTFSLTVLVSLDIEQLMRHDKKQSAAQAVAALGCMWSSASLTRLRVSGCADVAQVLARDVFGLAPGLTSLDISNCRIGHSGVAAIAAVLPGSRVTTLTLCGNGLSDYCGDEGAVLLASVLAKCAVRHLKLPLNRIGSHGTVALADACRCRSIDSLDLSSNKVGDEGVLALVAALRDSCINSLTFRDNRTEISTATEVELLMATIKLC